MPLIIPSNSISGEFEVANSLRFNQASSDHLQRTNSTPTSDKKYTYSTWLKRSDLGDRQQFMRVINPSSTSSYAFIEFQSDDKIGTNDYNLSDSYSVITNRVFRDVSAWYHIVLSVDTTQGTSSNRVKLYVNGVQETSLSSSSYGSQNGSVIATSSGRNFYSGAGENTRFFGGYMAETVFIDGQALDPTSFGEFDEDTGIWKPIDVSGLTFGTNGFYLDFENSGSLGADVSGNGNNFTVNNLTSIDQSTDTCTNNFCTLNPLIIFGSNNSEFKEGNLVYDDNRGDWRASVGTFGVQSGKWYWEMKLGSGTFHQVGIVGTTSPTSSANLIDLSQVHGGYSFYNDNGNLIARTNGGTISGWDSGTVGTSASTGDILMVALDMDNKFLYFGKNGTWVKSGNPTSGSSGTGAINISSDFTTGIDALPGVSMYSGSDGSLNFGSPPYSISSGNSDGNGYGNFEYAVPSGYYALNTKNLAEYG